MYEDILTQEVLRTDYIERNLSKADIARKYKTTIRTVNKYFTLHGIGSKPRHHYEENLVGLKFGRLLVESYDSRDRHGKSKWLCVCQCGNRKSVNGGSLVRGLTTSCGCYKHEAMHSGYMEISKSYWRRKQQEAAKRGYDFEISPEYVWDIYEKQKQMCVMTKLPIYFCCDSNKPHENTASIDRIDSKIGYLQGNIQIVHKVVNLCKNWLPDEEFIAMCNLVAQNRRMQYEDCVSRMSRSVYRKI